MTLDAAKTIYREKYWNALRCDELPAGIDYAVFDYGVNSGVGRSGKVLRRMLGLDDATSVVTREVVAAASAKAHATLIGAICDERMRFLRSLRTWPVFGAGWSRRVKEVRAAALALAAASPRAVAAPVVAPACGKGEVPSGRGQTAAVSAVCVGGAAAAAQSADPLVIILIVVGVVAIATALVVFWRWRQRSRQDAAA